MSTLSHRLRPLTTTFVSCSNLILFTTAGEGDIDSLPLQHRNTVLRLGYFGQNNVVMTDCTITISLKV